MVEFRKRISYKNECTIIVDARSTPVDITYQQDLNLLNSAVDILKFHQHSLYQQLFLLMVYFLLIQKQLIFHQLQQELRKNHK